MSASSFPTRLAIVLATGILSFSPPATAQQLLRHYPNVNPIDPTYDFFGYCVSSIGDVDGDGVRDVLIGAYSEDPVTLGVETGGAYVFSSATGAQLLHVTGANAKYRFGLTVCAIDDFDLDGIDDFLVSEPDFPPGASTPGVVHAFSGATGTLLFDLTGPSAGDRFGSSVAPLGDVDGDGVADFGVGAQNHRNSGQYGEVWILSGATQAQLFSFTGHAESVVSGVGDLDGDGLADFAIGAPFDRPNDYGACTVYSGGNASVLFSYAGTGGGEVLGIHVAGLGDSDGDGTPDFGVASISDGIALYSGADGSLLTHFPGTANMTPVHGDMPHSGVTDFNGDGFPDIVYGDRGDYHGDVYVFSGRSRTLLYVFRGDLGSGLGVSVDAMGDVNGDGFDDLVVGSLVGVREGDASVFGGNDLFLQANQATFNAGDACTLENRGGAPGSATCIFLTDVNGTAVFQLLAVGTLDAKGNFQIGGTVPTGLSGTTLTFMGYAVAANGHGLADSIPETIGFQ